MADQTIDGVPRELLERIADYEWFNSKASQNGIERRLPDRAELRALLDAEPEDYPPCDYCGIVPAYHPWHGSGPIAGVDNPHIHACNDCRHLLPGAQPRAEDFSLAGWSIDHSAGRPILMHNNCSVIEAEQAYGLLDLIGKEQVRTLKARLA